MKRILYLGATLLLALLSCTKEKTDYEAEIEVVVPDSEEFREAYSVKVGDYLVSLEARNGMLYEGYNELQVYVLHAQTKVPVDVEAVTFLPIRTAAQQQNFSGPHGYEMQKSAQGDFFQTYVVFPQQSGAGSTWIAYISFTVANQTHQVQQVLSVAAQDNKSLNMVAFQGEDGEQYYIALVGPRQPKVGENALVAGIFRYEYPTSPPAGQFPDPSQFSYVPVAGYRLLLDPRMPEPSMGNHSSPNNEDLVQREDGFYEGLVNYTMTGNWTLNFILLDPQGQRVKGTDVPTDFTPGVHGVKSELFIDILF